MSEISIVILTYNSIKFIKSCLDSIFSQDHLNFEVIVVDNGSKDGTASFIKENYPLVSLIENKENLGAAKARNQGIEATKGEWILTLDCDIILRENFLSQILKSTKILPHNVGIIQPKILRADRKTIYSTGIFLSSIRRFYDIGKETKDIGQFDKPRYVFGTCSAAAFYKRQMLEKINEDNGYFDARFFFLVEDVDLAWRAQRNGWKAVFRPEGVCYHFGNSSGCDKKTRQYLCIRNRLLLISKNEKVMGKIRLIPIFLIYDLPRLLFLLFNLTRVNSGKEVSK